MIPVEDAKTVWLWMYEKGLSETQTIFGTGMVYVFQFTCQKVTMFQQQATS